MPSKPKKGSSAPRTRKPKQPKAEATAVVETVTVPVEPTGTVSNDAGTFTVPSRASRSDFVGCDIVILPAFGPDGRNPRQGAPLSTHGGVAFEILRGLAKELGTLRVPFETYAERLFSEETYPNVSIRTQGNAGFRDLKHLRCDIRAGRVSIEKRG